MSLCSFVHCICYDVSLVHADVAELVDALDLGSSALGREGSSPFIRIKPLVLLATYACFLFRTRSGVKVWLERPAFYSKS